MPIEFAERLKALPPYVFVAIDQLKKQAIAKGADIISFGIGDPDLPTPKPIVAALAKAARDPKNHQYPDGEGLPETRRAAADYYERRFNVKLDPAKEVTTLIGSKEGIGHVAGAFVNPGETVAFPDPGYPVYHTGTLFAGGKSYRIYLNEENGFLPDLEKLPASVLSRIRLLWVCYPHSPSAAVAPMSYLKKAVWLAKKHGFAICSDAAYADIYFDGRKPPSMLEASFYVWVKTRGGMDSMTMFKRLLEECAIVTTPGFGLGSKSDDHLRLTLTCPEPRIKEALERIRRAGI